VLPNSLNLRIRHPLKYETPSVHVVRVPALAFTDKAAMNTSPLEREFSERVHDAIRLSHDLGYHPNRFEQMLNEQGALTLSRKLIKSGELQDGLKALAKLRRKDLSMESIMLDPKFRSLFSVAEIQAAEWRLSLV
jgi:hypothetical protein